MTIIYKSFKNLLKKEKPDIIYIYIYIYIYIPVYCINFAEAIIRY